MPNVLTVIKIGAKPVKGLCRIGALISRCGLIGVCELLGARTTTAKTMVGCIALGALQITGVRKTQTMRFRKWLGTRIIQCASRTHTGRGMVKRVRNLHYANNRDLPVPALNPAPVNTRNRYNATRFIDRVCQELAGPDKRYDVSISHRETRRGIRGARMVIAPNDLYAEPRYDHIQSLDVVTFVDTDYYVTDEELSSYAGHHMVLYSLCPDGLAGEGPNSAWRFVDETTVVESVAGGTDYIHPVWDWNRDKLVLSRGCFTYFYEVVQHDVGSARKVTVLILRKTVYIPYAIMKVIVPGIDTLRLRRMEVERHQRYLVGIFGTPGKRKVNLLPVGSIDIPATKIDTRHWEALAIKAKGINPDTKKASLLPSDVQQYMRLIKDETEVIKNDQHFTVSDYFTSCYQKPRELTFQCSTNARGEIVDEVCEQVIEPVAPPIVPHAVAPATSNNNVERSMGTRLADIINEVRFDDEMQQYAREFAALIVPDKMVGRLVPLDDNTVKEKQNRPQQVAARRNITKGRIDHHNTIGGKPYKLQTEAFPKRDANLKPGDIRLIQKVPEHHMLGLSSFMYPMATYMKQKHGRFYMPGKTPQRVAQSLQNCYRARGALRGGDYSRMDGRTSIDYRKYVSTPILMRAFPEVYHEHLGKMLQSEEIATVKHYKSGSVVETQGAVLSGSSLTTFGNTMHSAFNEYAARRKAGQSPEEALKAMGLYYGDDSLFEWAYGEQIVATANKLGMCMTFEEMPEGAAPERCVFLSRVYPNIDTCLFSYPCFRKALAKLTVSTNPIARTPEGKVAMCVLKGEACANVNGHVPVIGPFARLMANSGKVSQKHRDAILKSDGDLRYAFKHMPSKVELSYSERDLFLHNIALDLSISVGELNGYDETLRGFKSLKQAAGLKLASDGPECPDWGYWLK